MKYNKISEIENEIGNYLQDILNYSDGAYRYIKNPNSIYDKDELIYSVKGISECVETIEKLVYELEEECKNEQL